MSDDSKSLDLAWGAVAIGKLIDRSPQETFRLLESGKIPARKVGKQWVSSPARLRMYFRDILADDGGKAA